MKLKLILSAALMAGVISAQAATANSTVSPVASTNSTADAMKALFGDPVIVKGTGFEIKRSELDEIVSGAKANAAAQGQMLPPDFNLGVMNQLITIQLLLQKATAADRVAGKIEADLQYTNLLKRFPSPEAFQRQLKAVGMTVEELRGKATQEATAKATLKRELNISITEADAKDYYTKHSAEFEESEKAHVRHILLMTVDPATRMQLSTNTVAGKRKQIDDLLKRVKAGEDFAKLAKQYSEDPGSKENGGELPEFHRGEMVPEFEAAAFALTKDQTSDVVTSMFGYHIIKLMNKTAAKKFAFGDTIPQLNDTVANLCKKSVEVEKIKTLAPDFVKKMRAEYKVEILDPALKAMDEKMQASMDAAAAAPVMAEPAK
ncbi:MAG TPA: peptidylprolyl isomerase [Candidatus Limnocylindrales bacterium]|nr:peptidylprolyl isomerase [Candidatus Limnocylindrales bacterium]